MWRRIYSISVTISKGNGDNFCVATSWYKGKMHLSDEIGDNGLIHQAFEQTAVSE
jgi:hypothetical protein